MLKKFLCLFAFASLLTAGQGFAQKNNISKLTAKNAELVKLSDEYSFTEGPAVHRNGDVYFTDQPNNRIIKWSATRNELSVFMEDAGRSNGMYFDRESNLITCADEENQLWSINDKKEVKVLIENYRGNLLNGPNDLWVSPYGGIYITDPLYKREYWKRDPEMQQDGEHLYFLSPDKMQFIRVDENLVKPNGLVGTPDGKKLYVADIGDNKTYVYDITEDGYLTNRKLFAEMGSDGMAIDNRGNVYLTGKGVTVFNSRGNQIGHIPIEENWTANVVFGGTDRKTLFITAMGSVYTLQMKTRGVW